MTHARKVGPDIGILGTMHIEERFLELGWRVDGFGHVLIVDVGQVRLSRLILTKAHEGHVWEALGEQVASDYVLVVPALQGFYLSVGGRAGVLRRGAWLCAIEVFPSVHGPHGLAEAQGENGPVCAIRF